MYDFSSYELNMCRRVATRVFLEEELLSQAVLLGHQDTVPLVWVAAGVVGGRLRGRRVMVAVLVEVPGPLQGHKSSIRAGGGQRSRTWLATCLAARNGFYSALASHYCPTHGALALVNASQLARVYKHIFYLVLDWHLVCGSKFGSGRP